MYDHLRLGWRRSQVSQVSKRYRWIAEHLCETKSFLLKTRKFDGKLKNGKEGLDKMAKDAESKTSGAELKTKAINAKTKTKAT
mmetsp:Transcript_9815/g.15042  ORF Transcript_9815/g.15042 Transcript_9815/m.15042 type:complete len:83 (-) Transcript_9815:97-345(-)